METSHIILLIVSATISFAVGRTIMHMRKTKKNAEAQKLSAKTLREAPSPVESKNKAKRKRQQRDAQR